MGLRELLEQLRRRRAEMLEQGDPDGRAVAELTEALDEVRGRGAAAIDQLETEARESGDERRQEVTDDVAAERRMALDLLPDDLAGRVRELQHYDFVSSEARERFEQLMEELRQEVADTYFEGMSEALSSPDPEQLARMRDAFDALNRMLEQRERGEPLDPSFEEFMEQFGDMFPGARVPRRAARAAGRSGWRPPRPCGARSPPSSATSCAQLAESLLEDMDLRWQVERLAANLQRAFPDAGWGQGVPLHRRQPDGPLARPPTWPQQLGELDRMEEVLQSASSPAALSEIDLDEVQRHLGDDAARSLDRLAQLTQTLQEAGLIEQQGGRTELTPKGVRRLGQRALSDLFSQIDQDRIGRPPGQLVGDWATTARRRPSPTSTATRSTSTCSATVHNAVRRAGAGRAGPAHARGLRGGRDRGPDPVGHRAAGRPVHVDAHAGQLRAGQEDGDGPPDPHLQPIPPGLPRHRRLLRGGPGDQGRGPAHGHVGLRLRHQPAARAGAGPHACWPTSTAPSRSSW